MAEPPVASSPAAARLAFKLIEDGFGPVARDVIATLIEHGTQQYGELLRASALSAAQLRHALLVLVQHNCVNCYLKEEPPTMRGPGPSYFLYEAALPNILQILRVPRFLTHMFDEHGNDAAWMVFSLIEHGRLRWDQLAQAVREHVAGDGNEAEAEHADPDKLRNLFRSLVMERYIERVPACTLPPPPQQVHPNARKKKAAPKPGSEEETELLRGQQEAGVRQEYQQVRFSIPVELMGIGQGSAEAGASVKPAGKRKRTKEPITGGAEEPAKKRGRRKAGEAPLGCAEGRQQDEATTAGAATEVVLWRANYDEFNRRFRNDTIIRLLKDKFSATTAQAVEGMLLANARYEQTAQPAETVMLSVNDVSGALQRKHGNEGVPENVAGVLRHLSEDGLMFLDSCGSGPGGEQFKLHMPKVLQFARLHDLQAVIRNKFGPHAIRIWRLLLLNGQMEQKQVAELAMVPKEEAREALYAMLQAGYLTLQDVPRTNDRAPSRTFYTWRASSHVTIARMANDLYRAAGNLHERLAHEVAKPKPNSKRTDALEASLLELDTQLCLFSDV